jgi:hypothetical protein
MAASSSSFSKVAGQRLGGSAVGAGGMPTSPLPSCERVYPLVDHRVVSVSLASHVTLHDVLLQMPAICRPVEDIGRSRPSPHVELHHCRVANPKAGAP